MVPKILFCAAVLFAILSGVSWYLFLRPASAQTTFGVIAKKTFKPAGVYWQHPVGAERSLRTAAEIPIAEAYVFEIVADGLQGRLFFSLNTVASKQFEVGQKVRIFYRRRGLPFIWDRVFVEKMMATDE
jgi:hypothetical protein